MLQDYVRSLGNGKEKARIRQQWVDLQDISGSMQLAVIAAEDQHFATHHGFDYHAIEHAVKHNRNSRHVRGASTISQQAAKNLFLWRERSLVRKGLEAYVTVLIELLWSKERILEVYLNVAEMGNHLFGVEAASHYYFGRPAAYLNRDQAALLAAILPNPKRFSVHHPSLYVIKRKNWILRQMQLLGGTAYLNDL